MSGKEQKRMVVLVEVKRGKLSVAAAGRLLGVCDRQAKRIWRRFRKMGDAGLVHRNRGRPGPRRKPTKWRAQVLARYRERYPDFGPTLAAEKLQQEGLMLDHETLRRWLVAKDWTVAWERRWIQIEAEHERLRLAGRKAKVRQLRCGTVQLLYNGVKLRWKELPVRPPRAVVLRRGGRNESSKPSQAHPWRQKGAGFGKEFWRGEKARGAAVKHARRQAVAASGKPSLRSGSPAAATA